MNIWGHWVNQSTGGYLNGNASMMFIRIYLCIDGKVAVNTSGAPACRIESYDNDWIRLQLNIQNIADDSNSPHISSGSHILKVCYFWCHKLQCTSHSLHMFAFLIGERQSKVYDFDSSTCFCHTHNILRLKLLIPIFHKDRLPSINCNTTKWTTAESQFKNHMKICKRLQWVNNNLFITLLVYTMLSQSLDNYSKLSDMSYLTVAKEGTNQIRKASLYFITTSPRR